MKMELLVQSANSQSWCYPKPLMQNASLLSCLGLGGVNRRALETWEREYGPDHPKLAAFLNNQATLRLAQGEID